MLILRHATRIPTNTKIEVDALPAIRLPDVPGWLTGETPLAQGIETTLPNLPAHLELPEGNARPFSCVIDPLSPTAVRIRIAPLGHRVLSEQASWLGIVLPEADSEVGMPWQVEVRNGVYSASSRNCRVSVQLSPFAIRLFDLQASVEVPVLRTAERLRQAAGFPVAPPVLTDETTISINLEMSPEENILGFGEQFGRLVKNGQQFVLRTEDALGTGTGLAYKPVPVWHSTAGYLGLLNTGAITTVDVGHVRPSVLSLQLEDDAIDLIVITGSDPKARLAEYTRITGRAHQPPLWTLGYWMGRCRYHSAEEMLNVADRMRAYQVPSDVLHCDPDWLVLDRLNTDFIWNTKRFGDLATFCSDLDDRGFKLSVWEVPYVDTRSPMHAEAEAAGYLVRARDGQLAELTTTPTPDGMPRSLVDFTNPDAVQWWQDKHRSFLEAGVAVFKTDFGEGCPNDVETANDTPPRYAHNLYPLRYNGTVSDGIAKFTGRQPLVWGRSAWAGSQRYPAQWGGDAESTVAGMQATLRGGLSYALSAPGHWSHDIGGFYGPELTPELYIRWTQFGALSPLMRAHGLRPREPWAFGEDTLKICREWIRLRYSLLPYLWQIGRECQEIGLPIMRPMGLEFPADPVCPCLDDQYLLGSSLLVAPVFDDRPGPVARRVYLPAGHWFDLFSGEMLEGPGYLSREVSLETMPVFVRDSAVLPRVVVDESVRCVDDIVDRPWQVSTYGEVSERTVLYDFTGNSVSLEEIGHADGIHADWCVKHVI